LLCLYFVLYKNKLLLILAIVFISSICLCIGVFFLLSGISMGEYDLYKQESQQNLIKGAIIATIHVLAILISFGKGIVTLSRKK